MVSRRRQSLRPESGSHCRQGYYTRFQIVSKTRQLATWQELWYTSIR